MLIWARSFFPENNWKNNETTKPPFPWIITSGRDYIIFPQKIRRLQEVLPQAQATDNGRDGKRKMLCGTTRLYSNRMGCRNPVQWPSCFIALFSLFEFSQNTMQNARNTMANFASMKRSSKQAQKFLLHKHVTALSSSNRSPRPSKHMYRQTPPFNCIRCVSFP